MLLPGSARDSFAVARNEAVRRALSASLGVAAPMVRAALHRRIARHEREQARLRARYRIEPSTPIVRWGEEVERSIGAWADTQRDVRWAETSGSTAHPKRFPFTRARLRAIKRGSWEAAVQAGQVHDVRHPTLFVLAGLARDGSLSSLMLDDGPRASWLQALLMPSKLLWDPALAGLLDAYGATACRLWLLLLSDPGILYGTNPSTLAVFLDRLEHEWEGSVALARAHLAGAEPALARAVVRRIASPGWQARLARAAEASRRPPLEELLPGLRCYCCWDGGYVAAFLERVHAALPAPRFAHVPMYSMATETVETQTYFGADGRAHFLPTVPGVLYELLPEGAEDDPAALLPTRALEPGRSYALVVSDGYGLRRYATDDLFACVERVRGLPDLRFVRRQGLAYSFTGEKLTGEQVEAALAALRAEAPALRARGAQLALFPSLPAARGGALAGELPRYRLALAWPGQPDPSVDLARLGAAFEAHLAACNGEFAAKRESGRLGPTGAVAVAYDELARRLGGAPPGEGARRWEMQFKLLPLYARTWEACGLAELEGVA